MHWVFLILTLLAACCGCSDGQQYTSKVRGKVTLDGKPFTTGKVTSNPMTGGRGAAGAIQPDGTFVLQTIDQGDHVAPGSHRLAVLAFEPSDESNTNPEADRKSLVPLRYTDPIQSGLTLEVAPGEDQEIELKLLSSK